MNHKFKTLYRISFMICFLLFFVSCEKDFYEEGLKEQKRGITSRRITFDELKTNPKVISCLNDAKEKLKPKLIGNERIINVGDYFIETDDVLLLEYGGLKSYTFPIYFTEEGAKLKNLVIAEKLDGTYDTKVLEYDLTAQEKIDLANDELLTVSNPIVTTRINNNENLGCITISISYLQPCSDGYYHNGTDATGTSMCHATSPPRIKVITAVFCGGGGNNGIPGNPPDTGGDPTGTGGTQSSIPLDYPNSQTNPEEYEDGITEPVNPNLNNVNPTPNTPCNKIKSKTSSAAYMAKFNTINTPANYGMEEETGFGEVKRNGNLQYIDGIPKGDRTIEIADDATGYTHVHNNKIMIDDDGNEVDLAVKIHSRKDIDKLLRCSTRASSVLGSPLDAYGLMISDEGIFAITIINSNISSINLNQRLKKFEEDYDNLSRRIIEQHYLLPLKKQKMQEMFLALLKAAELENSIALFEGTTQTIAGITKINWSHKTLDTNGSLVQTPCQP